VTATAAAVTAAAVTTAAVTTAVADMVTAAVICEIANVWVRVRAALSAARLI
jgi:hypothetical protein